MANLLENFSLPDHILQRHCRKAKCNLSQVYDLDRASSAMLQLHASKHLPAHSSANSPTEFVEFGEFSRPYWTRAVNLRGLHKLPVGIVSQTKRKNAFLPTDLQFAQQSRHKQALEQAPAANRDTGTGTR